MSKKRQLTQRIAGLYGQEKVVVQPHGGTSQSDKPNVIGQDQIVTKDRIRKPAGLVPLTGNKVALQDIDGGGDLLNAIALVGDTEVFTGSINEYFINNHGSDVTYSVSTDFGSAVLSGTDRVVYTAPNTVGSANLTINGSVFTIAVANNRPHKPTILTPAQNATNVGRVQLFTADTMTISGPGVPNHDKSDWQVASDSGFNNIVSQSLNDAVNKTSWTATFPLPNTVYYARVRYHDAVLGWGAYSDSRVITTKLNFGISSEIARVIASDNAYGILFGTGESFEVYGGAYRKVSLNKTGNLLAVSAQTQQPGSGVNGTVYMFRKNNQNAWSEVRKISTTGTVGQAQQMTLSIPSGGSLTVQIQGTSPSTTTYTSSQVITIPIGTTTVILTGKGSNGGTAYNPGQPYIAPTPGAVVDYQWGSSDSSLGRPVASFPDWVSANNYVAGYPQNALPTPTYDGQIGYIAAVTINYTSSGYDAWVSGYRAHAIYGPGNPGQPYIPPSTSSYPGSASTATLNGSTYTFPGGASGAAATNSTQTLNLSGNNTVYNRFGTYVAAATDANGQDWMVTQFEKSTDGTNYTYDLIFYRNSGNDVWVVDTTLTNLPLKSRVSSVFDFSPDGSRFFIYSPTTNAILVYKRTTSWVQDSTINLTTLGFTGLSSSAIPGKIAIDTTGTKVGAVLRSATSTTPYRFVMFQQTGTTWNTTISTPVSDGLPLSSSALGSVTGNQDLSLLAFSNPEAQAISGTKEGTVTLYGVSGNAINKLQTLKASSPADYAGFGLSVDVSNNGEVIAISEPNFADAATFNTGGLNTNNWHGLSNVHLFEKSGNSWALGNTLHGSRTALDDLFGSNLSISDDGLTLAIAGDTRTGMSPALSGAVYIFQ